MTLPTGIQASLDTAKALLESGNNQNNQQSSIVDVSADTTPVVDMPTLQPSAPIQQTVQEPAPQHIQQTQPNEISRLTEELNQLRHQLSVITGKYDKEVPRLSNQLRATMAENELLRRQQPPPSPKPTKPTEVTDDDVRARYSKAEIDENGMEFLRSNIRVARAESENVTKELEAVRSELAQTREEREANRTKRFFSEIGAIVPDYRAVNEDPHFQEWLDTVDAASGFSYDELLKDAQRQYDSGRAAHILNIWKATKTPAAPSNRPSLTSQVVPSNKPGGPPPTPQQGARYKFDEWNKLLTDSLALPRKDGEALRKKLHTAYEEGRVEMGQTQNTPSGFA